MERDYYHQKFNDRVVSRVAKKLELSFAFSPLGGAGGGFAHTRKKKHFSLPMSSLLNNSSQCPRHVCHLVGLCAHTRKKIFSFFWTIIELSWQSINNDKNKLMKKTNTNSDLKLINSVRF